MDNQLNIKTTKVDRKLDYSGTQKMYKKEDKQTNRDYDLLSMAKICVEKPNKRNLNNFERILKNTNSNIVLANIIGYIKNMVQNGVVNEATKEIPRLIMEKLESKEEITPKM